MMRIEIEKISKHKSAIIVIKDVSIKLIMARLRKKKEVSRMMTFDKDDMLKRKSIAEDFNSIFQNVSQPFVIALDSSWGTGKTQFIHMWRNLLKGKASSIYINLWEEDFLQNPFFSLTEALLKKFEAENVGESQTRKDLKKVGWQFAKAAVNKVSGVNLDELIKEDHNQTQRTRKNKFKENLGKLADAIRKETGFPLMIFVDELDRCRPSYAVEFLETVKHFFDLDNIVFILGIDIHQLQNTVKSLYGEGIDAKEYLRKFIDINYSFPRPEIDNYLDILFSEFDCRKEDGELIMLLKEAIKKFNPSSLRKLNHLFIRLGLIEKDVNDRYFEVVLLLCLKVFNSMIYHRIIDREISVEEIVGLAKYFEIKGSNRGKIVFWKLANEIILTISNNKTEYLHNLKIFLSKLSSKWSNIDKILSNYASTSEGFADSHFSIEIILKIFLEDSQAEKQPNITTIHSVFSSKDHYLAGFKELTNKIHFLEGLDFSSNVEEDLDNSSKDFAFPKDVISRDEYLTLLKAGENLRGKIAFMLGFESGLSLSEIKNLKKEHVNVAYNEISVRSESGGLLRTVPVPQSFQKHHINYIPIPMTSEEIEKAFAKACEVSGLIQEKQGISFNSLRKGSILHCLLIGMGEKETMMFAGLRTSIDLEYYWNKIPIGMRRKDMAAKYQAKFGNPATRLPVDKNILKE